MRYTLKSGKGELQLDYHLFDPQLPTLIFLHDSLGCIQLWRDFPEELSKLTNSNYLVYDRLGYGQSSKYEQLPSRGNNYHELEADVLIEIIEALQIDQPILFGHSDGGTIAIIAASKRNDIIKGIITEGAHIFVEDITLAGIRAAKKSYLESNLGEKLIKYHGNKVEDIFNAWTETWLHESFRNWNIEPLLSSITCPCLIIQGAKDEYGTLQQVEVIISQVSGIAQQLIIKDIGHTPHRENKALTLKGSIDFIKHIKQVRPTTQ